MVVARRPSVKPSDYPRGGHALRVHPARLDRRAPSHDNTPMSASPTPDGHRSGFVAVVGRPSVGKSTLVNALLGQPVAPISPRPQTTRTRQLGILTRPDAQVILIDTPGLHAPRNLLGERLNAAAREALQDADVVLALFDLSSPPAPEDARLAQAVRAARRPPPVVVGLNKLDTVPAGRLAPRVAAFHALLPEAQEVMAFSALRGDECQALLARVVAHLPQGPLYYPEQEVTDRSERAIAGDLVRAAAMHLLHDEVPYGIQVEVDEYTERAARGAYIEATLYVERESHKGIVIGKGGAMLRAIGARARAAIEAMSGRRVYLALRVKVLAGWRDDPEALARFGFSGGGAGPL